MVIDPGDHPDLQAIGQMHPAPGCARRNPSTRASTTALT
jgi:hypothetical protein